MVRIAPLSLGLVVALIATLAVGCARDEDGGSDGRLRVVATIAPVGALAEEVGGELIDLSVLVKPGVDPHEYEIRTSDRKAIDRADVILINGVGIDAFLERAIKNSGKGGAQRKVTEGIEIRHPDEIEGDHAEGDGHDHEGADPHVWQNPLNAKVMVTNIAAALAEADPEHAETYRANANAYNARLDEVDQEIERIIEAIPAANRKMVTNHDAFGYFIERYGLEFVGAVIPGTSTASEPSAKDVARLSDLIKRERVKAIFAESSVEPKVAEQISKDTGVRIVDDLYSDSLGPPGSGAETLDAMLLSNARKIAEALT